MRTTLAQGASSGFNKVTSHMFIKLRCDDGVRKK